MARKYGKKHLDFRNNRKLRMIRASLGMQDTPAERAAVTGWCDSLHCMLYEYENRLPYATYEDQRALICESALDFDDVEDLDAFVEACLDANFVSRTYLAAFGMLHSDGVQENIDRWNGNSELGKIGRATVKRKRCECCGTEIEYVSPRTKYCDECRTAIKKSQKRAQDKRRYERSK